MVFGFWVLGFDLIWFLVSCVLCLFPCVLFGLWVLVFGLTDVGLFWVYCSFGVWVSNVGLVWVYMAWLIVLGCLL